MFQGIYGEVRKNLPTLHSPTNHADDSSSGANSDAEEAESERSVTSNRRSTPYSAAANRHSTAGGASAQPTESSESESDEEEGTPLDLNALRSSVRQQQQNVSSGATKQTPKSTPKISDESPKISAVTRDESETRLEEEFFRSLREAEQAIQSKSVAISPPVWESESSNFRWDSVDDEIDEVYVGAERSNVISDGGDRRSAVGAGSGSGSAEFDEKRIEEEFFRMTMGASKQEAEPPKKVDLGLEALLNQLDLDGLLNSLGGTTTTLPVEEEEEVGSDLVGDRKDREIQKAPLSKRYPWQQDQEDEDSQSSSSDEEGEISRFEYKRPSVTSRPQPQQPQQQSTTQKAPSIPSPRADEQNLQGDEPLEASTLASALDKTMSEDLRMYLPGNYHDTVYMDLRPKK